MDDPAEIARRLAELDAERKRLLEAARALRPPASEPTSTLKRRRLTDLSIRELRLPARGRVQVPDAVVGGLWLRISDTGVRSWSYTYRVPGDPRVRRLTIGKWPAIGCAAARAAAKQAAADVVAGKDPAREKREKRHQNGDLVEQVATEFIARQYRAKKLQSTAEAESMIRRYVLPRLAGRRIGQVIQHDLLELIDAVSDLGRPRAANKVVQLVKQLFKWAKGRGLITGEDPAAGLEKPSAERSRDRVLSDDELAAVWSASDQVGWPWREYVQLLILLGQRRTEVAAMKWADLDLEAGNWNLPAEQTKKDRARTLPLPGAVVEMLRSMPRLAGSDHVFGRRLTGFDRMKKRLDAAAGVENWILHDLRRSFATGQQKLGTKLEVTEQLLGHESGSRSGIIGVYQRHKYMLEQRDALEKWVAYVAHLGGGEDAKVVRIG